MPPECRTTGYLRMAPWCPYDCPGAARRDGASRFASGDEPHCPKTVRKPRPEGPKQIGTRLSELVDFAELGCGWLVGLVPRVPLSSQRPRVQVPSTPPSLIRTSRGRSQAAPSDVWEVGSPSLAPPRPCLAPGGPRRPRCQSRPSACLVPAATLLDDRTSGATPVASAAAGSPASARRSGSGTGPSGCSLSGRSRRPTARRAAGARYRLHRRDRG